MGCWAGQGTDVGSLIMDSKIMKKMIEIFDGVLFMDDLNTAIDEGWRPLWETFKVTCVTDKALHTIILTKLVEDGEDIGEC